MATIDAISRDGTGKGVARRLRAAGKIPGVLYGGSRKNLNFAIEVTEWAKLMDRVGGNLRIKPQKLIVDGEDRKAAVLLRDMQVHPVSGNVMHIDLLRFDAEKELDIEVPIVVSGEDKCPGLKRGGIIQLVRHELEVHCKAKDIPESINVSVAGFDIGDVLHIEDVELPSGVEVITDINFTLVSVVGVKGEAADDETETEGAGEGEAEATEE
ncbi:MAG: 50S ribosomal protein L25/general stress protein Ctc [Magnetococcales bacterium]|nr:50S ribosomal protein L25/general stress protein Ctc [Magnetococcales bacterium]